MIVPASKEYDVARQYYMDQFSPNNLINKWVEYDRMVNRVNKHTD